MTAIVTDGQPGPRVVVAIVTFNRLADLRKTIESFLCQRAYVWRLLVVDNCSTDGTREFLLGLEADLPELVTVHRTDENRGGAGGFSIGVDIARQWPVDWIFLTDDDAIPRPDCLRNLLEHAFSREHVFGCTAVNRGDEDEHLCWPIPAERLIDGRTRTMMVETRAKLEQIERVRLIPFLGFLVSRERASQVDLPNPNYFISGDDVEYGIRLQQAGARLYQVRDAVMEHPAIPRYCVRLAGRKFYCLRMAPWRRFYDVRNRIWNGRLQGGLPRALLAAATQILRLVFTLVLERDRRAQARAYGVGIYQGLFRANNWDSSASSPADGAQRHEPAA